MAASGVGAAIALAADRRRAARRDRLPGLAGRGAGQRQGNMIEDGLFDGLDAALLYHPCDRNHVYSWPLASEDIDVVFTGLAGARLVGPVEGQERPRCDGPAVQLRRPVAPAAPAVGSRPRDHPGGRHRREHHPGTDPGLVHAPQPRAGLLRDDEGPVPRRCARPPPWPPAPRSTSTTPGGAIDDEQQRVLGGLFTANMNAYGIDETRATTPTPAAPTWATSAGSARRSIRTSRSRRKARPGTRSCSATPRPRPQADETTLLAATLVAQTAYDLFADPALVEAAWQEFRGVRGRSLGVRAGATIGPARPAGRRSRTGGAPSETEPYPRRRARVRLPEDPVAERPLDPSGRTGIRRPQRLGRRVRVLRRLRPADLRRPVDFSKLPWVTDPDELRRREVDVAIVGAPFDDAVSHRPGARFGPRAIREAQYTSRLDLFAPARRRPVRGPDRRRCG